MILVTTDNLTFLDYLSRAGVVVILLIILYGGFRKWWVFGWVLKESDERCLEIANDRDEWKTMALKGAGLAERAMQQSKE